MDFSENEFRDYLFDNHKESIHELIVGRKDAVVWQGDGFPPISFLLQQIAEKKINSILDDLESLILTARELRLVKKNDSTTRIDLFGNSERGGLTIIELKKSKQTERQAYTELLAYANHFCSVFPGLREGAINSILIAPMETRTVKDAFTQELLNNNKSCAALTPKQENGKVSLEVYYPDESYYHWFENNMLDDQSMITVAIAFQTIEGWIDLDTDNDGKVTCYSKDALNTVSNTISHKLEAEGLHTLVYASQKWGEIGQLFPYPNVIYVVAINPFSSFRTGFSEEVEFGNSKQGRLSEIQSIYDQLSENDREFWVENLESSFHDFTIRTVKDEFNKCFENQSNKNVSFEISLPDWYGLKTSMIDAVCTHNLDIYQTGLLREIYMKYVGFIYNSDDEAIFYGEDLPMYSYDTLRKFLPVWEILRGLGLGEEHA